MNTTQRPIEEISQKILDIRGKYADSKDMICVVCGKFADNPFRLYVGETLTGGCVDACHTPHFADIESESAKWHFRPEAVSVRQNELDRLMSLD